MFKGRYEHALDAKGRVALPAAFRRELGEGEDLVVTPHIEAPCLVAYPPAEWRAFEQKLAGLSQVDPSTSLLNRLVVGRAQECPVDKVGRVLLPASLRALAGIERDLVWMGQLRRIEVWAPDRLEQVAPMAAGVPVTPETLARLAELGL